MNHKNLTGVCIHPDITSEDVNDVRENFDVRLDSGEKVYVNFGFLFGWEIFIHPEGKRIVNEEDYIKSRVCVLMPHMRAAVITDRKFYEIPKARKKLREADYVLIQRTLRPGKNDDPDEWLYSTRESIIRAIRSEKHPEVKSIDSRLIQIVQEISRHIHPKLLTFGTFKPNVRNILGYGGVEVEFHDKSPVLQFYQFSPDESEQELNRICKGLPPHIAVGLTSRVLTEYGEMHIPMIDFSCRDIETVLSTIQKLEQPGTVVASGNSYHFYGFRFLTKKENMKFLDSIKSYNFSSKGVDERWVNYQLKRGYSNLRVTPSLDKFSQPCFVGNVYP